MPATIQSVALKQGRYTVEQELQSGTKRSLFQAYDVNDETSVSIFEVPVRLPKAATSAQRTAMAESFIERASRLAKFKHRTVVGIRDSFVEAGRHYVVTDPVDGFDLASLIDGQKKPFALAEVTAWADSLLEALNNLHTYRPQLVHGNVRPDNIIIAADGTAKLVLSGMMADESQGTGSSFALGNSSAACYSPLEQIWDTLDVASQKVILSQYDEASEKTLKQDLDGRSDIYSLGATLYQLTTGRRPQDPLERSVEMMEGNADPLIPPSQVEPGIPVEVSDVIKKALELKREYRFDSAAIMRQVLKTALVRAKERGAEISESTPTRPETVGGSALGLGDRTAIGHSATAPERPKSAPVPNSLAEIFDGADLEDDLLGILSDDASQPADTGNVPELAVTTDVPTSEALTRDETPDTFEGSAQADFAVTVSTSDEHKALAPDVNLVNAPEPYDETAAPEIHEKPAVKAATDTGASTADPEYTIFTEQSPSKGKLPMMIAAAVVLCLAGVGGWFFLGKPTQPQPAAMTPAPTSQEPAIVQQAAQPAPEPESSPESQIAALEPDQTSPAAPTDAAPDPSQKTSRTTPQAAKPKNPPAAQKAPVRKKAVTVDDLINDN